MSDFIYNVPLHLAAEYEGRRLILRTDDPAELVRQFGERGLENIAAVQLLSLETGIEEIAEWGEAIPVDILMPDPAVQFTSLYKFSKLLDTHPIRITIAVTPGFTKAVKLAVALRFVVRLDVGQPDNELIEELSGVLDFYLHQTRTAQPVDFFQSVFLHFYEQVPTNLWLIQEEDPDAFRFITDDGEDEISPRFGAGLKAVPELSAATAGLALSNDGIECETCKFLEVCGGYFKWPKAGYDCSGVKSLFGTIRDAASEIKKDLDAFAVTQGESTK